MSTEAIKKQVLDAFDHRVAVRVYNDQEISREDMEFILDTAWLSPSSIGLEAWRFVVLDRKQIAKLRDDLKTVAWGAQSQLDTASHFVLLLAEKNARYDSDSVKDSLVRRGLGEGDALKLGTGVAGLLDHAARLEVLGLVAHECAALTRLDVLELDDGTDLVLNAQADAVLEISGGDGCHETPFHIRAPGGANVAYRRSIQPRRNPRCLDKRLHKRKITSEVHSH